MSNKLINNLIAEGKRFEEDNLYSSKGHFFASNFFGNLHLFLGIPTIICTSIAGTSALSQFNNHSVIAALFSIIAAIFSSVLTFINPNNNANLHKIAGNKYNSLKNKARLFYEIDCNQKKSEEELTESLKNLDEKRGKLNQDSPIIPPWAYKKAKKGIMEGEAVYKVDRKKGKTS